MELFGGNPLRGLGDLVPDFGDWATKLLPNTKPKKKGSKEPAAALSNSKGQEDYTPSAPRTSSIVDSPPYKPGADPTKLTSTTKKPTVDPLQAQLAFFQLVMPFLQQTIQKATGGMNDAANQYEQDMSGVVSNMPQSLQSIYGNTAQNVSGAMRNEAGAQAQSALAMPEYSFMMGLIESLRTQQEQAMQQQMMIDQLQKQLAAAPQEQDDESTALFRALLQLPDAKKTG